MKTAQFGQNFLKSRRIARRLVHTVEASPGVLAVDLGSGKGIVTQAILEVTGGPVLAVEIDSRLARHLEEAHGADPRVTVVKGDIRTVPLPKEPFVVVGNIPFNVSTQVVRRWATLENFRSGALIVEREFGLRLAGEFKTTKLSASLGAILDLSVPFRLHPTQFHPRPRANLAILKIARREVPFVASENVKDYWMFTNYLFEQSQRTIGESLAKLKLRGLPRNVSDLWVQEADVGTLVSIFNLLRQSENAGAWKRITRFEESLPENRRALSFTPVSDADGSPAEA